MTKKASDLEGRMVRFSEQVTDFCRDLRQTTKLIIMTWLLIGNWALGFSYWS